MTHRPPYAIQFTVLRDGKVLEDRWQRPHTLVNQFFRLLYGRMVAETVPDVVRTNGSNESVFHRAILMASGFGTYAFNMSVRDLATNRVSPTFGGTSFGGANGIVLGTGSDPTTPGMFNLQSTISGNDLGRGGCECFEPVTSGGVRYFFVVRPFFNLSGSTIPVREVGLVGMAATANNTPTTFRYFLLERTPLDSELIVPDQSIVLVRYKWST